MEPNYFEFDQQCYNFAIGSSTPSILAETYRQHEEYTQIYQIIIEQQINVYFRYVYDTIYDQNKTNIEHTLNEFNKLQTSTKFTIKNELHESINF